MDDMSRAHWAAHPSATALLSPESRAKVLAAALLVADNSAIIERQHATSRRGAHAHEQTYADSVANSSARQMLKQLREATPLSAPERPCRDFAHGPPREGHVGRGAPAGAAATGVICTNNVGRSKLGRGRPDLPPGECKKRRRVDKFNAWVSSNVHGRLTSHQDRVRYHQEMLCKQKLKHFEDLAIVMTRAQECGVLPIRRRHRSREFESRLRRERAKHVRASKLWSPKEARAALVKEKGTAFHKARVSREAALKNKRRKESEDTQRHRAALAAYAERVRMELQDTNRPFPFRDTWPRPDAGLGPTDRTRLSVGSGGASSPAAASPSGELGAQVHTWFPSAASMESVMRSMPTVMSQSSGGDQMAWEAEHVVLTGRGIKVPGEKASQRLRRLALASGRCICTSHGRVTFEMARNLSAAIFRWVFAGGPRKKRAAMPPKSAKRSALLEEAKVVLEAKADGEVFWALLAYTTFEAGALPSLLRLRRPAAKEQPRSGVAASLVVADFVELECTSGRGSAQWCSLLDFVELCDPSLCWTVRFWTGYRVAEWRAEESEAEPWWRGESDTAGCADAELPPSDGENEDDRREASERAQDERACSQAECSQASDDLGEQSEEEPRVAAITAMAAAAKARKRKGQSFECLASRRAGRYALSFHLVFKDGSAKKRSQFQITCDHHPPEVLLNKAGKPYKLACRKTLGVYGDGPEDEREKATVRKLVKWVRAGPCVHSRLEHQGMRDEDIGSSSSDTDDEECGAATPKSGGRETVGDGSRSAACFAGGESEGGACASSPGDLAACAPSPAAQEPPPHRCWFCGGDHNEADCEWYRILFVDAVPIASNATALRPMGHLAAPSNAVTLERRLVQTKDVPSDGACLFHALGTELKCVFPQRPNQPASAQGWRERLVDYVLFTNDCVGGTTVQDWVSLATGMEVGDYVVHMGRPTTWGSFLEVSLIVQMWSRAPEAGGAAEEAPLTVVILQDNGAGGFQTLSFVGSSAPESKIVSIAWQGAHWVRARLKPQAVDQVTRWMMLT